MVINKCCRRALARLRDDLNERGKEAAVGVLAACDSWTLAEAKGRLQGLQEAIVRLERFMREGDHED